MGIEGACLEVHQTLLQERGSTSSIRGGGTLGGEEEGGAVCLFHFSLSLSIKESESGGFITIIVCLVRILLSVLETGLSRKYSQNKCSKFQKPLEAVETCC